MKKTLLLTMLLLLSFAQNTFSQDYHPLLNNTSWIINNTVSCCRPTITKVINQGTDTIVGLYTYKKFKDAFPQNEYYDGAYHAIYKVCLREDVAARKVYKLVNGVDALLYDFNFETGDVMTQYGNTFTATVDYITANDLQPRKRIQWISSEEYCGHNLKMYWIEGIGSPKHPFYPQNNMYNVCSAGGGVMLSISCVFQDGIHVLGGEGCSEVLNNLGVEESSVLSNQISFSPNPFSTELNIQSGIALQDATIQIYNVVGQLVRESKNQSGNKLKVNRDNLSSGLYFIQLYEKGKPVKTAKIMVE